MPSMAFVHKTGTKCKARGLAIINVQIYRYYTSPQVDTSLQLAKNNMDWLTTKGYKELHIWERETKQ